MSKKRPSKITEEDFSAWRDNAITEAVFEHFKEMANEADRKWVGYLGAVDVDPRPIQLLQVELNAKKEMIHDLVSVELRDIQDDETGRRDDSKPLLAPRRREPAA